MYGIVRTENNQILPSFVVSLNDVNELLHEKPASRFLNYQQ